MTREETPFSRIVAYFMASPIAVFGLMILAAVLIVAIAAPFISPQNPYDLAQLDVMDGRLPPGAKTDVGTFWLGTDDQGRDMLSAIFYGLRISLTVGVASTVVALALGLLIANGYQYLLSGKYWISFFPGVALLITIVSINLVADQLRDVLNPRLQR